MSLPRGSRFSPFASVRLPTPKAPPPLGVGSRVTVTCRSDGSDRVTLTDDNGTSALATVAEGVEVEILAWRPRRGADTRYRVVAPRVRTPSSRVSTCQSETASRSGLRAVGVPPRPRAGGMMGFSRAPFRAPSPPRVRTFVFAVGQRAYVACSGDGLARVTLTD